MPLSSTPAISSAAQLVASCAGAKASSIACRTSPKTTTLLSVPRPGRWRSGIQKSSSSAPTKHTQMPVPMPVRFARPWCSTSQGTLPRPESRINDALKP